jgi:APA family basic amino acid/polyamine antiporter
MAIALVVGNMIGSGVFLLPASLGAFGGISILGWVFTAAGALLLALVFARLSRMVPLAGGPYAYARAGFGDFAGFLVAWGYWISIWCANAALGVALVSYLSYFAPSLAVSPWLATAVVLSVIWLLTWVNARGVREAGSVQLVTTVLKLLPLIAVATLGLAFVDPGNFRPFNVSGVSGFSAVTASAALTLWAFLGFESATVPAEEIEDPERTVPKATIIGTVFTALLYILATVAVRGVIPPAVLASSTAPFGEAAEVMWGRWAGSFVAAGAVISCFGALNGWILLQGRVPYAAARDGVFPAAFARLSPRGTPVFGLVFSSVLVTMLLMLNFGAGLVDQFTFIILLATLTALLPYTFATMAELMLYIKHRPLPGRAAHGPLHHRGARFLLLAMGDRRLGAGRDFLGLPAPARRPPGLRLGGVAAFGDSVI